MVTGHLLRGVRYRFRKYVSCRRILALDLLQQVSCHRISRTIIAFSDWLKAHLSGVRTFARRIPLPCRVLMQS